MPNLVDHLGFSALLSGNSHMSGPIQKMSRQQKTFLSKGILIPLQSGTHLRACALIAGK